MTAYYNDNDPYCARWLRALVDGGHLPDGHVDERSILDISPDQLAAAKQAHLFCGIGGWPLALKLAGWIGPCWTASLPCQPLSSAGQQLGHADERHLWPAVYALIDICRPATVFGEQVASKDGREWLAGVRADLEQLGYAVGASDLPAACVGAPHIRQRLFWVAHDPSAGRDRGRGPDPETPARKGRVLAHDSRQLDLLDWLADADRARLPLSKQAQLSGPLRPQKGRAAQQSHGAPGRGMDVADGARQRGVGLASGGIERALGVQPDGSGPWGFWNGAHWLPCSDGKWRRIKPGVQPVAHGISGRVGYLRAAGNALVPPLAAAFVRAVMEVIE